MNKIKEIIVYSSQTCPPCFTLKQWLKKHEVNFEDRDIANSTYHQTKIMIDTGSPFVPQTIVRYEDATEQIVKGLDYPSLRNYLNIKERNK